MRTYREGVEIGLLQASILKCELLKERGRGSEDCSAFDLGGDYTVVPE
jgi:hypothetical protein